jgi:Gas vesicle synthesis protein GvpL/GvpF
MADDRVYIYGVIRDGCTLALDAPPVSGDGRVYTVVHGGLAAVVSDGSLPRYELTRRNIRYHQAVLDCVLPVTDVLPARLGTTLPSVASVTEELLDERRAELERLLDFVSGRIELGLKVSWTDMQRVFREVVADDAHLRTMRDRVAGRRGPAAYQARVDLGDQAGQALAAKRTREADKLVTALVPHAVSVRRNDPMSDLMVLNAAFLVDRAGIAAFQEAVDALDVANQGRLGFLLAGPLPAFNFVALHITSKADARLLRR